MNRRTFVRTTSVAATAIAAASLPVHPQTSVRESLSRRIENLVDWIRRGFFANGINLLSNLPSGKTYGGTDRSDLKNLYWLQNCNLFGMYALEPYDPALAQRIRKSYKKWYAELYPDVREQTAHYLAVGQLPGHRPPDGRYFRAIIERRELSGYTIGTETYNPEVTGKITGQDPRTLLKSGAIAHFLRGDKQKAEAYFKQAMALWDGSGFINTRLDRHGAYYTRHISYALIAERILRSRIPDSIRAPMERQLWSCQDTDGGIWTNYMPDGSFPHFAKKTNESGPLALLAYPK